MGPLFEKRFDPTPISGLNSDESCIRTPLKFEVDGLKDLCKRNPNIPKVYSKCELAGYAKAANGKPLEPPPIPRPICKSHSNRSQPHILEEGVPGGYIRCEPEPEEGARVESKADVDFRYSKRDV